jgi:hypothetical protein
MGHSDPSMILKVYQHVQDVQKRAAVEALPDILHLGETRVCPITDEIMSDIHEAIEILRKKPEASRIDALCHIRQVLCDLKLIAA